MKVRSERILSNCIPEPNTGCLLWLGYVSRTGHGQVFSQVHGSEYTHVIIFRETYQKPWKEHQIVCHKCNVASCCNIEHLYLGDHYSNAQDAIVTGTIPRGIIHCKALFTEEQILAIRNDTRSLRVIARGYGCGASTIKAIKDRRTWRHV